jgi:4a-hydroxytetrahydrobiopterin dehydratase
MAPLTPGELATALASLPGWSHRDGALHKTFRFASFLAALAFMQRAAPGIDALDHHPEWTNVYDRVRVRLTTHDAGNLVTARDADLARLLDGYAERDV